MRHDPAPRRIRRGYAIIAGATLLAALIFNIDFLTGLLRNRVEIVAFVTETSGVRPGSAVTVDGMEVGTVAGVGVARSVDGDVGLRLHIDREAADVIRQGSRAQTSRRRFIGEPVVLISAGPTDAPAIRPGDTLRSAGTVSIRRLIEQGRQFPDHLDSLHDAIVRVNELAGDGRWVDLARRTEALSAEALELRSTLARSDVAALGPAIATRLRALQARVAALADAANDMEAAYADQRLADEAASMADRARRLGLRLDDLEGRFAYGTLTRLQQDSALVRAIRGVTAQIDSLTADGLGFALRMISP